MRLSRSLLVAFVATVAIAMASAADATTLRLATSNTNESIQGRYATRLAELVSEKTDGEVTVQVFCCSQMGDARERIESAHLGQIDMGIGDFAALAQFSPDLSVFNVPYLFEDPDHAMLVTDPARSEVAREQYAKLSEASNLTILGSFYYGTRQLTTSDFPVRTPDDLAGRKIRAIPSDIFTATVEGMGAIPTPIAFSEVPMALATGVVDGQENPLSTIVAAKLYESQDYLNLTGHITATLAVYMNENSLAALSSEHQAAISEAVLQAANEIREIALAEEDELVRTLVEGGMTVIGSEEGLDREAFRTAVLEHIEATFPQWKELLQVVRETK